MKKMYIWKIIFLAFVVVSSFSFFNRTVYAAESYNLSELSEGMFLYNGDIISNDTGQTIYVWYMGDSKFSPNCFALYFSVDESKYTVGTKYTIEIGENHTVTFTDGEAGLNRPVMVYGLDLPPAPDPDPDPTGAPVPAHEQHAAKAELLPEKNTDGSYKLNAYGVPVIVCSECGQVHSDFAVAHEAWLDEVENAVKNHKNFGTDWKTKEEAAENPVTITTSTFISFDKDMLSYLNSQPDAVILKFKYQGKYYVTTIPSDFDCLSLADENGWAGFAYIMSICGGREISEEEFKM